MERVACGAGLALLLVAPGFAGAGWPLDDAQLRRMRPGAELLQRLDVDLSGDGVVDTVVAFAHADAPDADAYRAVEIFWGHRREHYLQDPGGRSDEDDEEPNSFVNLQSSPHGGPHLSVRKDVLLVEDLTGGTTATQATYRYRYEAMADDMRLIGMDMERYSRTNAHGSLRLSWNVVTGARIAQRSRVANDGKAALAYGPERRWTDASRTYVYMPDTPSPDELLDQAFPPAE